MSDVVPTEIDLTRKRGDTYADLFTLVDEDAAAVDITGRTYLLTVDPEPNPGDAVNNLFQLTGSIVSAPAGTVEFAPSAGQSDQTPADYYYDIQQTDAGGKIRTIATGKYSISQDITK